MLNAFFCLLPHERIMSITGTDSKKFLQGQLTSNLDYLSSETSSLSACCTIKGRIISSFRTVKIEDNHYLLVLDKELFDKQLNEFKKYAIFSKVTFSDADLDWNRIGLEASPDTLSFLDIPIPGKANQITYAQGQMLIKVSDNRFELWIHPKELEKTTQKLLTKLDQQPLNHWLLGQIQAGIGQVFIETSEQFVPQMINLQSLGGVSFKKGCYIGQEIVARMQYLGKLKQHLYRFTLTANELPDRGEKLFSNVHSSNVGEVVLAAKTSDEQIELLAVVRDEAVNGDLWMENKPNQLLKPLPLPYEVNYEEEIKH